MQQEAEFTLLAEKLRKHGADDEIMLQMEYDYRLSLNPEHTQNQHSGTLEQGGRIASQNQNSGEKIQGMRSGLQVRSTLMRMSQNN